MPPRQAQIAGAAGFADALATVAGATGAAGGAVSASDSHPSRHIAPAATNTEKRTTAPECSALRATGGPFRSRRAVRIPALPERGGFGHAQTHAPSETQSGLANVKLCCGQFNKCGLAATADPEVR